jgi:HPt (histidine-containing phosphotransfer) domain-containing protein
MSSGAEDLPPAMSFGDSPAPAVRREPPLPPAAAPVVDPEVLGKLMARFGSAGAGLRDSLIGTWLAEIVQRREELSRAVLAGDRRRVAQAAHAMRSGSGALGARELAEACGRLEEALSGDQPVDLEQARTTLEAALDRAVAGLSALRGS